MQKWSPEPLSRTVEEREFIGASGGSGAAQTPSEMRLSCFRSEYVTAGRDSLLDDLTSEEREQIYQLVEADIEAEYEEKYQQAAAERKDHVQRFMTQFGQALDAEVKQNIQTLARETVGLAIAMAEKIVRTSVALDAGVLQRTLETVLTKLDTSAMLSLTVNPEDAQRLQSQPELLEILHVKEVKSDRRIEQGGCWVKTERYEWDVTLARQITTLAEVVQECLESGLQNGADADDSPPVVV